MEPYSSRDPDISRARQVFLNPGQVSVQFLRLFHSIPFRIKKLVVVINRKDLEKVVEFLANVRGVRWFGCSVEGWEFRDRMLKKEKLKVVQREGGYFVVGPGRELELGPHVPNEAGPLLSLTHPHAAVFTICTMSGVVFVIDLIALQREYHANMPEPLTRFLQNGGLSKFFWGKNTDQELLQNAYGQKVLLGDEIGNFDVPTRYENLGGPANQLEKRFDLVFSDMGILSARQFHFEYARRMPADMALIAVVWRLPKELRATCLLYMGAKSLQVLYLAIAGSFKVDRGMPSGVPEGLLWANLQRIVPLHAAKVLLDRARSIFGNSIMDPASLSAEWDFNNTGV